MPTFIFGVQNGNNVGTLTGVSVSGYLDGGIGHSTNTYAFRYGTTTTLQVDNNAFGSSLNFPAGIEHTLITMA